MGGFQICNYRWRKKVTLKKKKKKPPRPEIFFTTFSINKKSEKYIKAQYMFWFHRKILKYS